jgi:hypothetical protein
MRKPVQLVLAAAIAAGMAGCATGPVRRSTLGEYSYATIEWTKKARPVAKPAAVLGGIVVDTAITAIDTVTVPVLSVGTAVGVSYCGPDPIPVDIKHRPFRDVICRPLAVPILFPFWYPVSLYVLSYGGGFGPQEEIANPYMKSDKHVDQWLKDKEQERKSDQPVNLAR